MHNRNCNGWIYTNDPRAFFYTLILFVIGALYYFAYSRHHLVAKSADEEFAMLALAESELQSELE